MAGRPRTMLRRVTRILEQQQKLADELHALMPKQYLPGPDEGWDYPDSLNEWGDDTMRSWRKAVLEIAGPGIYLEDLVLLLQLKVEKIEQKASLEAHDAADEAAQNKTSAEPSDRPNPNVEGVETNQGEPADEDTLQDAAH